MICCPHCSRTFTVAAPSDDQIARAVQELVAEDYGLPVECLWITDRRALPTEARRICFWILRHHAGWSLERIGAAFGRDHSGVGAGLRRIADHCATEKLVAARRRRLCVEGRRVMGRNNDKAQPRAKNGEPKP